MDHKAGNQLPHGWMMGFSTVQVELFCLQKFYRTAINPINLSYKSDKEDIAYHSKKHTQTNQQTSPIKPSHPFSQTTNSRGKVITFLRSYHMRDEEVRWRILCPDIT